jgi:uncharacterized OB-fold protein
MNKDEIMKMKKHKCPVCGNYEFPMEDSFDICDVCGWEDDQYQINHPDETGANSITLNEAKEQYVSNRKMEAVD